MSIHDRVDLARWLNHFPLDEHYRRLDEEAVSAFRYAPDTDIYSPEDLALLTQMRQRAGLNPDSGTPFDLLLPAHGEPSNRAASKICGTPYRPKGEWPKDKNGSPLLFLAQICFADSRDVLPASVRSQLPGDVLLIFAENIPDEIVWTEDDGLPLSFEWHSLGIPDDQLVPQGEHPENLFAPTHFQVLRSTESEECGQFTYRGLDIEVAACARSSKIGGMPIWQQHESEADGLGTFFAALHAVNPCGMDHPFPNVPVPPWGQYCYSQNFFCLGDAGTLYLFWDGSRVRWLMQCG